MIKRAAGGGDEIQVRTNYKDEMQMRIQTTFFLSCNDFPPVEPIDALSTLEVFEFYSAFHPASEIAARGDTCPRHWREADPNIKTEWVPRPDVIDAFTMMVLEAWKPDRLDPPECVAKHTKHFSASASVPEIDRFKEVVKYTPNTTATKVFTDEIKLALENAGLKGLSSYKIGVFVDRLYGHEQLPPCGHRFWKGGEKGYGFDHLKINEVRAYDANEVRRTEKIAKDTQKRRQAWNGDDGGVLGKRNSYDEMDG